MDLVAKAEIKSRASRHRASANVKSAAENSGAALASQPVTRPAEMIRFDDIGNRLKAFRLGSGLSAEKVANRMGISRTALYRLERGEMSRIDTIAKAAELLNVSLATLLGVRGRIHLVRHRLFRTRAPIRRDVGPRHFSRGAASLPSVLTRLRRKADRSAKREHSR